MFHIGIENSIKEEVPHEEDCWILKCFLHVFVQSEAIPRTFLSSKTPKNILKVDYTLF